MKYQVNAQTKELLIYGVIGDDFWAEQSIQARDIVDALADLSGDINVRINSQGGSMEDAIAISTALKRHEGEVVVDIDGVAHSAASFIAMAGDKIRMDANAIMMIHGPSTVAAGNARDLEDAQRALQTYTEAMRPAYERDGLVPSADVEQWLTDGQNHYFTAAGALEIGLVDGVTDQLAIAAISINGRTIMPGNTSPASQSAASTGVVSTERAQMLAIKDIFGLELVRNSLKPSEIEAMERDAIQNGTSADVVRDQVLQQISARLSGPVTSRSLHDGGSTGQARVDLLADGLDKMAAGMTDAIELRMDLNLDDNARDRVRQSEYMGMSAVEMARRCLEANGKRVRGMNRNDIVGAALTASGRRGGYRVTADRGITHTPSDFPALLENALNKAVLKGWEETEETWRMIGRPSSIPDFKPAPRAALGEMPTLPPIDPNTGEFQYVTVGDRKEQLVLGTYGDIIGIARATLVNDDLAQFGRLGMKQGRAASRRVGDLVYFVLTSNPTMLQTGNQLFSAPHGNIAADAGPPTIERLDEMKVILALQQDPDQNVHGLQLPLQRVIVPMELDTLTRTLRRSQYDPADTNNSRAPNPFQDSFDVVADARLSSDSATQWYGSTNPDTFDLIEVGFLEGRQEPYMETKDGWTVDGVEMKVRIDAAAAPMDFRTIVRNAGA